MDWDWEDGPPSDTPPPRRAVDEPAPAADPRPPRPDRPQPARPEQDQPEPLDESVTQVFSAEDAWEQGRVQAPEEPSPPPPSPEYVLPDRTETGRPAPSAEFERPRTGTIEAAERAAVGGAPGPDDGYERRSRSPQDRAARREQRRRQLRRRRIVALAILIAIVVLIVVLVVRGCGGSDAAATAALGMVLVDRRLLVVPERL
jgi:hypothetical protein